MSRSMISDDVLNITVGIKLESGVTGAKIRNLIDDFASGSIDQTSDLAGFLWVENIPQYRRADFLVALSLLSANADPSNTDANLRMTSAADIWPTRLSD